MNNKVNKFIGLINKSINISEKSLEVFLVILSVSMVLLVFSQVIFRYVFFYPISWSEELATFMFIWAVLLGAAVGFRKQYHLGINILTKHLPNYIAQAIAILTNFIIICFFALILKYSWDVAMSNMMRRAYVLDISVGYIRMVLPITCLFSIVYMVELEVKLIYRLFQQLLKKDPKLSSKN